MLPELAPIVVVPRATSVASPVFDIVATAVFDEVQDTPELISRLVPSAKKPIAANCSEVWDRFTVGFTGLISIEFSGDVVTVTLVEPEMPSALAEIVADPGAIAVATPDALM